jgi:FixJ family two-component response regulator
MSENDRPGQSEGKQDADTVIIIDDERAVRHALAELFRSADLNVLTFNSAPEFLSTIPSANGAMCLILDVRLPIASGFDLQAELTKRNIRIPIIFITGYGDVPSSVKAMKAGAIDFLMKPVQPRDLLQAARAALDLDRKRRASDDLQSELRESFQSLTARERQIMYRVIDGHRNKQIAYELGISEITVKVYRRGVMQKMRAKSLPDLVRMAETLGVRNGAQRGDGGRLA